MNYDFSINIAIWPPQVFLVTPLLCSAILTTTTIELHKLYIVKFYAFVCLLIVVVVVVVVVINI